MRIHVISLVILLAAAVASPVRAEDPKKAAKKLLVEGDKLFKKGDYEGALDRYKRAFEAFPSAKIYVPMGITEEKLGRDVDAYGHYELLLSEAGDPIPDELRNEAQNRMAEIEKRIVSIKFDVRPLGSTITVDNVELGQTPLDKPVRLMPGNHAWSISKDGFMPVEKEMELQGGTSLDEVVQLEKEPAIEISSGPAGGGSGPGRSKSVDSAPAGKRKVLIAGIVTSSALLSASLVFGLFAMSKHDIFSDTERSVDDREAARDSGQTMATVADVMLVFAIGAGAFTTYWYFKQYKPAKEREGRAALVPYATPDGGGVAVMGRF
jgi:hypothetical protein